MSRKRRRALRNQPKRLMRGPHLCDGSGYHKILQHGVPGNPDLACAIPHRVPCDAWHGGGHPLLQWLLRNCQTYINLADDPEEGKVGEFADAVFDADLLDWAMTSVLKPLPTDEDALGEAARDPDHPHAGLVAAFLELPRPRFPVEGLYAPERLGTLTLEQVQTLQDYTLGLEEDLFNQGLWAVHAHLLDVMPEGSATPMAADRRRLLEGGPLGPQGPYRDPHLELCVGALARLPDFTLRRNPAGDAVLACRYPRHRTYVSLTHEAVSGWAAVEPGPPDVARHWDALKRTPLADRPDLLARIERCHADFRGYARITVTWPALLMPDLAARGPGLRDLAVWTITLDDAHAAHLALAADDPTSAPRHAAYARWTLAIDAYARATGADDLPGRTRDDALAWLEKTGDPQASTSSAAGRTSASARRRKATPPSCRPSRSPPSPTPATPSGARRRPKTASPTPSPKPTAWPMS